MSQCFSLSAFPATLPCKPTLLHNWVWPGRWVVRTNKQRLLHDPHLDTPCHSMISVGRWVTWFFSLSPSLYYRRAATIQWPFLSADWVYWPKQLTFGVHITRIYCMGGHHARLHKLAVCGTYTTCISSHLLRKRNFDYIHIAILANDWNGAWRLALNTIINSSVRSDAISRRISLLIPKSQ